MLTEVGAGVKLFILILSPSLIGRALVFEINCIGSSPMGFIKHFFSKAERECSITGRTFVLHTKDVGSSPTISKSVAERFCVRL